MVKTKVDKGVTLIAANAKVEGDIRFSGELYVSGSVTGNITAEKSGKGNTLVVSESGSVKGDVRVANAVIGGNVEGNMHVRERLEVSKTAKMRGDVYYKLVELNLGAVVEGRLVRGESAGVQAPAPALLRPTAEAGGGGKPPTLGS